MRYSGNGQATRLPMIKISLYMAEGGGKVTLNCVEDQRMLKKLFSLSSMGFPMA